MSLNKKKDFVVQKHAAKKAGEHYDLRLEMPDNGSTLVSWAIRKGPSMNPDIKRLAIQTEDHDPSYGSFEGVIAEGQYGAGKTLIWDKGDYELITKGIETSEDLKNSDLFEFKLNGEKLKGNFVMIKTDRGWLLKKKKDGKKIEDIVKKMPESVVSGKTIDEISKDDNFIKKISEDYEVD